MATSEYKSMHGMTKAAGCKHLRMGNFCKLFDKPTWAEEAGVDQRLAEKIAAVLGGPGAIMHDVLDDSPDCDLPAGYTFFAQFVDHDVTLDIETKLHGTALTEDQIRELPNLRSASLDLDCVYGLGPEASPHLYSARQPGALLVGNDVNPNDLPRNKDGRALIGDPRNDENLFVSQLQLAFLRFHNRRLVGRSFEEAREDCRNHFQYVVLYDLLKRICHPDVYKFALKHLGSDEYPFFSIQDECGRLCMPVEFSVAAYRFGHTTVRSKYPVNARHPVVELFAEDFGTLGFGPVPPELTVDWSLLLPIGSKPARAKAFDHLLPSELIRLPDPVVGDTATENERSLAFRNLLRGFVLGLPSGQSAAQALQDAGYPDPIDPGQDLRFGEMRGWTDLDATWRTLLEEHTPLFLYVLREAGVQGKGQHLGPVGSAIVLEVFINMLKRCASFLDIPDWVPDDEIATTGDLTLGDIVRYATERSILQPITLDPLLTIG